MPEEEKGKSPSQNNNSQPLFDTKTAGEEYIDQSDGYEVIESDDARLAQKAYKIDPLEKRADKVSGRWVRFCDTESNLKRFKEAGIETILYSEELGFQLVNVLHSLGKEAVIRALGSWWTPQDWIKDRPGPGKTVLAYVPREYIDAILSAFFPGRWSFDAYEFEVTEHEVNCLGKLTVFWPDGTESWCVQPGVAQIKRFSQGHSREGEPISIGNDKKAASTDARKKAAATLLRIAWDVYSGLRIASKDASSKAVEDMQEGRKPEGKPALPKQTSKKPAPPQKPANKQREEYKKRFNLLTSSDPFAVFKGYMKKWNVPQEVIDEVMGIYPSPITHENLQEALIDIAVKVNKAKNGGGAS